ncbi:MAG: kynureninase [Betaproteobacteria bacterium]|nr:kynureninase [Betaproteobacteria bacterium]NBY05110.1 kynureninase [Betaproteobacteria bacterium]
MSLSLQTCQQMDLQDPLRPLRDLFDLPPGMIYLDGNSLGALPRATAARLQAVIQHEWGVGLIRSYNTAQWFDQPHILGDRLAPWLGAGAGEVLVTDTTSVNLFKVLSVAMAMAAQNSPGQRVLLSEVGNFPTDLYMAESVCAQHGWQLRCVQAAELDAHLSDEVGVLMLTHVNYRTGALWDMGHWSAKAHAVGAMAVWDLAHSAGAVPLALKADGADFAVGCGYKYLNGGPGAPAFVWAHPDHVHHAKQPLTGWWGHAQPFAFTPSYEPATGMGRFLCGSQSVLAMAALACGLDTFERSLPLGGMSALRQKSLALTDAFIGLVQTHCAGHGLVLETPLNPQQRGSQVSLSTQAGAYAMVQALIERGVVGDFRAGDPGRSEPDIMRFGFTPLYLGFEDVWRAVDHLRQVLDAGIWRAPRFAIPHPVT